MRVLWRPRACWQEVLWSLTSITRMEYYWIAYSRYLPGKGLRRKVSIPMVNHQSPPNMELRLSIWRFAKMRQTRLTNETFKLWINWIMWSPKLLLSRSARTKRNALTTCKSTCMLTKVTENISDQTAPVYLLLGRTSPTRVKYWQMNPRLETRSSGLGISLTLPFHVQYRPTWQYRKCLTSPIIRDSNLTE